jgi:Mor family transcriptional regulator
MPQGKHDPERSLDIFARFLSGEKPAEIAARYDMTLSGTHNHISRTWSRIRSGLVSETTPV